ncbi:MAG: endosialidase [Lachnospiraceae bacterium]|nr:endosialidase [Lachnospiraceae bacterium]
MSKEKDIIKLDSDGNMDFGDFTLTQKTKHDGFEYNGDIYKVKTWREITKLERNGLFLYESVPGTTVISFKEDEEGISFEVIGEEDAQITLGLADETEYEVSVNGSDAGILKSSLGGKLDISVEFTSDQPVPITVKRV